MRQTLGRANLGLLAALSVIATACASMRPYDPGPGRRVAASVLQDAYVSGETVNITISNLSDVMLFYPDGFCKTQLQKRDGSNWMTVTDHSSKCPIAHGFLDPGQTVVLQYRLPKGVSGGVYRVTMPMPTPEEAVAPEPALQTPAFKVAATPVAVGEQ